MRMLKIDFSTFFIFASIFLFPFVKTFNCTISMYSFNPACSGAANFTFPAPVNTCSGFPQLKVLQCNQLEATVNTYNNATCGVFLFLAKLPNHLCAPFFFNQFSIKMDCDGCSPEPVPDCSLQVFNDANCNGFPNYVTNIVNVGECEDVVSAFNFFQFGFNITQCNTTGLEVDFYSPQTGPGCVGSINDHLSIPNGDCSNGFLFDCDCACFSRFDVIPICPQNCMRSIEFWKTHNPFAVNPNFQTIWPDTDPITQLCDILQTAVCDVCADPVNIALIDLIQSETDGDAWVMLAKQLTIMVLNTRCYFDIHFIQPFLNAYQSQADALLAENLCDRPILEGEVFDEMVQLAIILNGFNNGTCTNCPLECSDSCAFDVGQDIVVKTICESCIRLPEFYAFHYACTESAVTGSCSSCPWPVFNGLSKCIPAQNLRSVINNIGLLIPTEATHWCDGRFGEDTMGRTWLEVLQQTNQDDDARVDLAQMYIAAVLGVLDCGCECSEGNVEANITCEELAINITTVTQFFYGQPFGRCPAAADITAELIEISDGMFEWLTGNLGTPACTGNKLICADNPVVMSTFHSMAVEPHLNAQRPEP